MLSAEQKRELLAKAKDCAAELAGGEVTRSEWRHVAAAFFHAPCPPARRLAQARELIEALPSSWVRNRSNKTAKQLARVQLTLRRILGQKLSEEELRFLVGWTARLLYVRGKRSG
jgi:hypothetical protein